MNSGNRVSAIAALSCLGAFAAADAGRVGEDGTGAMWVAPELVEVLETARLPGCANQAMIERADLSLNGSVVFDWHPETGELSFTTDGSNPAFKRPGDFSAEPLALAIRNCVSR